MTEVELQQYLPREYPQENTWYGWVFINTKSSHIKTIQ